MPSVASEPQIFPPARILPDPRPPGAQDPSGFGSEPSGFAELLDSEHESTKPDRHDDTGPAKSSRRSNAAHAKDKAPAQDQAPAEAASQAAAEENPQDAIQQAKGDTPKDADQKTSEAADETTPNGQTAETGTDASIAAVDGTALADALFPVTISTTPVAAVTVATDAPLAVPPVAAAESAPVAAPSAALSAQSAQAPVMPAVATNEPGAAKPIAQPATQPAKAQPQSAAPGETARHDASPSQAKPAVSSAQPIAPDEAQPRPDSGPGSAQNHRGAERAPVVSAETAADPIARPSDAAAAVKAGADLVQSLGVTAPAPQANAAPMQGTAAAAAAAAAAPTATQAAPVPMAGLAVEIAAQSLTGKNRFEIRLDPPELGRIDVRLEIDNDGHVRSRLVVERSETLDLLRRDAPQLERALQQAGLKTGDHALEFSLRHQTPHRDDETHQDAARLVVPDDGATSLDAVQQNYGQRLGLGGGIDIRV